MQTVTTLPILQTASETTTHYVGLQPALSGKTSAEYVNQNISFNPASNTLNIGVNVNFLPNAVNGVSIAEQSMRGSKIVPASLTSNLLTSDLRVSLSQVLENANVFPTAIGGNVNIDLSNNVTYFFSSNCTANVTFNFRASNTSTLDSVLNIGQSITSAILLKQGATRYRANVYIDGVLRTPWWLGNSAPSYATSVQESIDVYSFSIMKTAQSTFTLLASNANFQIALNQNP
jgi:hypothetical protein